MSPRIRAKSTRAKGNRGEDVALSFLQARGYRLLERNFRYERGEIDLVMDDGRDLVFVEVKTRHSGSYGEPEDAVTPSKRNQLRRVAEGYLLERGGEERSCRFDVVAIRWNGSEPLVNHLENAF